jgi:hypothetical protein
MKITFIKGSGKFDQMVIHRAGATESIDCPKQGIIPHDMVHYAVESTLLKRGFLTRVKEGEAASFQMQADPESDGVERRVEVIQGDAWSGGNSPAEDMIDLYQVTCSARQCPPLPVTAAEVLAIRRQIEDLDRQWKAVPVGQSLDLEHV